MITDQQRNILMTQTTHATKRKTICKPKQRRPIGKQAEVQLTQLNKLIRQKEKIH